MKKKIFAQKIENYVKFNWPKGFLRIFKTLKNHIFEKKNQKSKMYTEESV